MRRYKYPTINTDTYTLNGVMGRDGKRGEDDIWIGRRGRKEGKNRRIGR